MGTTADKLQAVLNSKNAIRDKFSLGDIPFAQYAENIKTGSGAAFYLCSYVNRNYFSYNTIIVSGMPTNLFVGSTFVNTDTWESAAVPEDIAARDPNGTYTLQNPFDAYGYWWWKSENGCIIDKYDMGQPIIYPDENYRRTDKYVMVPMNESTYSAYDYPAPDDYTSYTWQLHDGSVVAGGSAVVPKPAEVEKYWEGYKLEADENGKYNLSPDKTKLTYADYMPVAGRIYDEAATLEITNADFTEDALWACPRNMTSAENDDWVVSSTSVYDNRAAYLAFDGNSGSSTWLNSGAWWIMWQNKTQKVLLQQIKIALGDNYILNKEAFLQGSNDGNEWVDIITPGNIITGSDSGYENGVNTVTIKIPDNGTPYSYYRLGSNYNTGSYSIIYSIEAYAQIPREVPK